MTYIHVFKLQMWRKVKKIMCLHHLSNHLENIGERWWQMTADLMVSKVRHRRNVPKVRHNDRRWVSAQNVLEGSTTFFDSFNFIIIVDMSSRSIVLYRTCRFSPLCTKFFNYANLQLQNSTSVFGLVVQQIQLCKWDHSQGDYKLHVGRTEPRQLQDEKNLTGTRKVWYCLCIQFIVEETRRTQGAKGMYYVRRIY